MPLIRPANRQHKPGGPAVNTMTRCVSQRQAQAPAMPGSIRLWRDLQMGSLRTDRYLPGHPLEGLDMQVMFPLICQKVTTCDH